MVYEAHSAEVMSFESAASSCSRPSPSPPSPCGRCGGLLPVNGHVRADGVLLAHVSESLASYLVAILNGASIPGRAIPGILRDKFGRFNLLAAAGLLTGVLCFCWVKTAGIIVLSVAFGFASGAIISGSSIVLTQCTKDPKEVGTYIGTRHRRRVALCAHRPAGQWHVAENVWRFRRGLGVLRRYDYGWSFVYCRGERVN